MQVSTGNKILSNNDSYGQPLAVMESDNQWENSESNVSNDSEYLEQTEQSYQSEQVDSNMQIPINNKRGKKKTGNQVLIESFNNQTENVVSFALGLPEITKLTAISTLLGYRDVSLFAKDLVVRGVEPYFELASQTLKKEHFNHNNQK